VIGGAVVGAGLLLCDCAPRHTPDPRPAYRSAVVSPESILDMVYKVRNWRFESGQFFSVAAVDSQTGLALQPYAFVGANGLPSQRFMVVYPVAPGSMVEVTFRSTAKTREIALSDLAMWESQRERGEIAPEVAKRVREKWERALNQLTKFEGLCLMNDLPRCHAVEATVREFSIAEWLEQMDAGAEIWLENDQPCNAARLYELAAKAGMNAEQYHWRAAVAFRAAGRRNLAETALARFRNTASTDQLAQAAATIEELQAEIALLPSDDK
jgi:hypothetical protein